MADDGVWLTVPHVARYLGLVVNMVRRKVTSGEIPSGVDRRRRVRVVRRSHVDAWVRDQGVNPGSLAHLDSNRWAKYRNS